MCCTQLVSVPRESPLVQRAVHIDADSKPSAIYISAFGSSIFNGDPVDLANATYPATTDAPADVLPITVSSGTNNQRFAVSLSITSSP
jgi:hypothetical protein